MRVKIKKNKLTKVLNSFRFNNMSEVNIKVKSDKMILESLGSKNVFYARCEIPCKTEDKTKHRKLKVRTFHLLNACERSKEEIEIQSMREIETDKPKEDYLYLEIKSGRKNFNIPFKEIDKQVEDRLVKIEHDFSFRKEASNFKEVIDDLYATSRTCHFFTRDYGLFVEGYGETFEELEKRKHYSKYLMVDTTKNIDVYYGVSYLNKMNDFLDMFDEVEVRLKKEYPIRVKANKDGVKTDLILAPRAEEW